MNSELRNQAAAIIDQTIDAIRAEGVPVTDEAVNFLKANPTFLSMPALRVVCRAPSFVEIFDPANNAGMLDMNKEFEERLVAEMTALGDEKTTAEVHVGHASSVARVIVRKSVSSDQQYVLMDSYNEVPSSVAVINDINFPQ